MPGVLVPLTAGQVSGTNSVNLDGNLLGGFLLTADGTNLATITLRDGDASGTILVQLSSVDSLGFTAPIRAESGVVHYVISGTGATGMLFEWKE